MVVVTERSCGKQLFSLLRRCCRENLSVLLLDADTATLQGDGADIILVSVQHSLQLDEVQTVFVVCSRDCLPPCPKAVAVVDSACSEALALVAGRHYKALTCGLSNADSFTFSSLTEDSAVISLQRQISAFDGSTVDPFELPVTFSSPIEPFTLLACAAILCLLGERSPIAKASALDLR